MKKVLGLLIALGLMVSPVVAGAQQAAGDKAAAPAAAEEKKPAKKAEKKAKKAKKAEKKEEMKKVYPLPKTLDITDLKGMPKIDTASIIFFQSTPVLTPEFSNIKTKSSVATFPAAPGANGHPPNPPAELSKVVIPKSRNAMKEFKRAIPYVL